MPKKIISLILVLVLLLSAQSISANTEESFYLQYFTNYTFESAALGSQPESSVTNGNSMYIASLPSDSGKCVYFEGTGTYAGFINMGVCSKEDIVIEFDLRITELGNGSVSLEVYDLGRLNRRIAYFGADGNLYAPDGTMLAVCGVTDTFNTLSVCIKRNGKAEIYLNGVKKTGNVSLGLEKFTDISEIRLNMSKHTLYLDNFCAYSGTQPLSVLIKNGVNIRRNSTLAANAMFATDTEMSEYLGGGIIFYDNKNKYYENGETKIWNNGILFRVENGKGILNENFVKEKYGFDNLTDIGELSEKLGKKLTLDKSGIAVISDRENFFNFTTDMPFFKTAAINLVFDDTTGSEMHRLLNERIAANEHPRLFGNSARFNEIKELAKNNERIAKATESVINVAKKNLDGPILQNKYIDNSSLDVARSLKELSLNLGLAYRLTGDEKYAAKLWEHMEAVCDFSDWNEIHFLTTGEYLFAMAVGYDWIYDYLSDVQRKKIEEAILNKGLTHAMEDYNDVVGRKRTFKWAQVKECSNWKTVCNTGVIAAATTLMDIYPDLCETLLGSAMENIKVSALGYAPDGAWSEGTTYWLYNTMFYTYFINILDAAYGNDFGYMDAPGMKETIDFMIAVQGSNGTFNYGDSNHVMIIAPEFLLFSNKLKKPSIQKYFTDHAAGTESTFIFNYVPEYENSAEKLEVPLDYYARETETVMLHSSYDSNSIFTAVHSGRVSAPHGQYDSGEFILDAYGTDFAYDLGSASYSLSQQPYLYRRRTEGHNMITINNDYYPGQDSRAFTKFQTFESGERSSFAITDLSSAYSRDAVSMCRGVKLFDNRQSVILQDEFELYEKSTVDWALHTKCPITVSEDGRTAEFTGKYKNMRATIQEGCPGTFRVEQAKGDERSPHINGDSDDSRVNKLMITLKDVKSATIAVAFTFNFEGDEYKPEYDLVKLDDWKLEEGALTEKPSLQYINVDGKLINNFNSGNKFYTYYYAEGTPMPKFEAKSSADVKIEYPDKPSGLVKITVSDKNITETYAVKIICKKLELLQNGEKELFVFGVEASDIPQEDNGPENTIDDDLSTRYSAMGTPYLIFDLGEERSITSAKIAVWQGDNNDKRKQSFEIYVSKDGVNYEFAGAETTTGTTLEQEYFKLKPLNGRYVKLVATAVNGKSGGWNSFTEVTFFGR